MIYYLLGTGSMPDPPKFIFSTTPKMPISSPHFTQIHHQQTETVKNTNSDSELFHYELHTHTHVTASTTCTRLS